jgi:hypothetical protein
VQTAGAGTVVLAQDEWRAREAAHAERVDRLVAGHLERAGRGVQHPVEDFLFTYYSLSPGRLRRWHPGAGTALAGRGARERLTWRGYSTITAPMITGSGTESSRSRRIDAPDDDQGVVGVDVADLLRRRGDAVRHARDLLAATASRPAALHCFGLHEWAMVYRLDPADVRHPGWPLRLGAAGTDAVVEGHRIRCTHHDAFRFFTGAARPLNVVRPRREDQVALEQPGCLHATMDLYKLAYTLLPATPSDLVVECFVLARDVRALDMRASPYDLRDLGYPPVAIETAEGKAEYTAAQRSFADRAAPLRTALLDVCARVLAAAGEPAADQRRCRPRGAGRAGGSAPDR